MSPPKKEFGSDDRTAVIYARFSSHAQREVSIDQQIRACRKFAERQDITVVGIYEDRAMTGTNDRRPGFQKMIQDAEKATWDYVIVYTLDRFARNRYDSAIHKRHLKNCGVKVLSAMENISDDPTGILMESILEGYAEYYSQELSRKVNRGMDDNASKCLSNGSIPLGYDRGPDGRYVINEAEAEVIREIYRRVIDGHALIDIARDLNARGITTKRGGQWNRSSFNSILSNERYLGIYIFRDTRIPGGIPPIVTQSIFDEVQAIIHAKPNCRRDPTGATPQRRRRDGGTYLLTGKLFCGHCKSAMTGVSGTNSKNVPHYYYTCKRRRADHSSCDKRNIPRGFIEDLITKSLKETMLTDEGIQALADASIAFQNKSVDNLELEALEQKLANTKRSLNNLLSAAEAGIFTSTTQNRMLELESLHKELSRKILLAQQEVEEQLTREEIIAALSLFQSGNIYDKKYQESLIDAFLVAAYVYDDHLKIIFNLGNKKRSKKLPINIDSIPCPSDCLHSAPGDQKSGIRFCGFQIFYWCDGI